MEKINKLKKLFKKYNIDGYIVPKNDEFFNEYIPENKDRLNFISNFTGSYGFAIILKNESYLFVDGRYTLQAKNQSGKFFKIITIPNKLPSDIFKKRKLKIGFDPKLHTQKNIRNLFIKTNCKFITINQNLVDKLWLRKTHSLHKKFYVLPEKAIGLKYNIKIKKLVNILKTKKIDFHFISAGENIAWLLNIRGQDSNYTPIPNSYLTINNKVINLFCDTRKINNNFKKKFKDIKIIDIKNTGFYFSQIKNKKILIDSSTCSIHFKNILKKDNKII